MALSGSVNQRAHCQSADFQWQEGHETGYSLHHKLNLPLNTIQSLLDDLLGENLIKFRLFIENGRVKKRIYVMAFTDYSFDEYTEAEVDDRLLTSILNAVEGRKITVLIHRKNGDQIQLSPFFVLR